MPVSVAFAMPLIAPVVSSTGLVAEVKKPPIADTIPAMDSITLFEKPIVIKFSRPLKML